MAGGKGEKHRPISVSRSRTKLTRATLNYAEISVQVVIFEQWAPSADCNLRVIDLLTNGTAASSTRAR